MWGRELNEIISKLEFSDNSLLDIKHITSYTEYLIQSTIGYLLGIFKKLNPQVSSNAAFIPYVTDQDIKSVIFPEITFSYDSSGSLSDIKFRSSDFIALVNKYPTDLFSNISVPIFVLINSSYVESMITEDTLQNIYSQVLQGNTVYVVLKVEENVSVSNEIFPPQVVIESGGVFRKDILKINKVKLEFSSDLNDYRDKYAIVIGRIILDDGTLIFVRENLHFLTFTPPYEGHGNWAIFSSKTKFSSDNVVNDWVLDLRNLSVSRALESAVRFANKLPYISTANAFRKGILDFNGSCKIYTTVVDPLETFGYQYKESQVNVVFEFNSYDSEIILNFYTKQIIFSPKLVAEHRDRFFDDLGYAADVEAYEDQRTKKGYIVFKARVPSFLKNNSYSYKLDNKQGTVLIFGLEYDSRKNVLRPGWYFRSSNLPLLLYNANNINNINALNSNEVRTYLPPFTIDSTKIINSYFENKSFPVFYGDSNNTDVPSGFLYLKESVEALQHYEYKKTTTLKYNYETDLTISDYRIVDSSGLQYTIDPSQAHFMYRVNFSDGIPLAMVFVLRYISGQDDYLLVRCPSILTEVIRDIEATIIVWQDSQGRFIICPYGIDGGTAVIAPSGSYLSRDIYFTFNEGSRLNITNTSELGIKRLSALELSNLSLDTYFKSFGDSLVTSLVPSQTFNGLNILALDPQTRAIPRNLYEGSSIYDIGTESIIEVPTQGGEGQIEQRFTDVANHIIESPYLDHLVYVVSEGVGVVEPIRLSRDVKLIIKVREGKSELVYDFASEISGTGKITIEIQGVLPDRDLLKYLYLDTKIRLRNLRAETVEIVYKTSGDWLRYGVLNLILDNCDIRSLLSVKRVHNDNLSDQFDITLSIYRSYVNQFYFHLPNIPDLYPLITGFEVIDSSVNFFIDKLSIDNFLISFISSSLYSLDYLGNGKVLRIENSSVSFDLSSIALGEHTLYGIFNIEDFLPNSFPFVSIYNSFISFTVNNPTRLALVTYSLPMLHSERWLFNYFNDKDCYLHIRDNKFLGKCIDFDPDLLKLASFIFVADEGRISTSFSDINNFYIKTRTLPER